MCVCVCVCVLCVYVCVVLKFEVFGIIPVRYILLTRKAHSYQHIILAVPGGKVLLQVVTRHKCRHKSIYRGTRHRIV